MSETAINQVLDQMRAMASRAQGSSMANAGIEQTVEQPDFAGLLKDSVNRVNDIQQNAAKLAAAFDAEDPNVDLAQVMIALERSSLSFQALNQVRNKLLSAYQEIMSMPV